MIFGRAERRWKRQNMATLNFPWRPSPRARLPTGSIRPAKGLTGARAALWLETAELVVDLLNRAVSVGEIAAREGVASGRSRREIASQRLEKIESVPGKCRASEGAIPLDLVRGRAAGRTPLRLTSRNVRALGHCRPSAIYRVPRLGSCKCPKGTEKGA